MPNPTQSVRALTIGALPLLVLGQRRAGGVRLVRGRQLPGFLLGLLFQPFFTELVLARTLRHRRARLAARTHWLTVLESRGFAKTKGAPRRGAPFTSSEVR